MASTRKKSTLAIHGNETHNGISAPVAEPIYQTSTYIFPDSDAVERYMVHGERKQHIYARYGNPSQDLLDERMALMEGTEGALFFASGMGAITTALLSVCNNGDEIISIPSLYGQTLNIFRKEFPERYGITTKIVPIESLYELEKHVTDKTRLVYFESPTNPNLQCVDMKRVTNQAKALGLKTMIDNTFATPINQSPAELGVDYVLHSATKYLGGHSDVLSGVVCGPADFIEKCHHRMHLYGPTMDPFAVYLMLRSLKTLEVRVHRQNENAMKLAEYFAGHPKCEKVHYPGLPNDEYHEVAKKQMNGFGGMLNIAVKGSLDEAKTVVDSLEVGMNATSLGGVETLVSIPVLTSHVWLSQEERKAANVLDSMIRISAGLEAVEDIIADFEQALDKI